MVKKMETFTIIHYGHFRRRARTWSYLSRHRCPGSLMHVLLAGFLSLRQSNTSLFWKCASLERNTVVKSGHALRIDLVLSLHGLHWFRLKIYRRKKLGWIRLKILINPSLIQLKLNFSFIIFWCKKINQNNMIFYFKKIKSIKINLNRSF